MRIKCASSKLLCAAAAATTGLMASSAKAIFVFDVRAVGATGGAILINNKSVITTAPGTVTFELWGMITAPYQAGAVEDGNPNNEATTSMNGSFLTTGTSVKGTLSATVVPQMQGIGHSVGTMQDLDGDGDLDIGSNNSTIVGAEYWSARATDIVNSFVGQAQMLGTMTLTITQVAAGSDTTVNFRKRTGAFNSVGMWRENGTAIISNSSNVLTGAPVSFNPFFDPEPASTGLITVIGLTTLARRKSRTA